MNTDKQIQLYCGDVFEIMKSLPDEFVDCVVTSPPYWAVRDYGNDKQIGMEEHPEDYIIKIVEVIKEEIAQERIKNTKND